MNMKTNTTCEWKTIGYKHVEKIQKLKEKIIKKNIKILVILALHLLNDMDSHNTTLRCYMFNMNLSLPTQLFKHLTGEC